MGKEQRQSLRAHSRLTASIKLHPTGEVGTALTKDISGSGVCLLTEQPIEVGTPVEVEVTLPDSEKPVRFLGQVMWSRAVGGADQRQPPAPGQPPMAAETGLRFVSVDPKDRTLLVQYAMLNALPS